MLQRASTGSFSTEPISKGVTLYKKNVATIKTNIPLPEKTWDEIFDDMNGEELYDNKDWMNTPLFVKLCSARTALTTIVSSEDINVVYEEDLHNLVYILNFYGVSNTYCGEYINIDSNQKNNSAWITNVLVKYNAQYKNNTFLNPDSSRSISLARSSVKKCLFNSTSRIEVRPSKGVQLMG